MYCLLVTLIRIDSKSHWCTEQIFLVFITEWGWEGSLLIYLKHVTLNIFTFQWKVPKEMHQIIYNLPPSVEQAFVYLLIGKACHCIDVRVSLSVCLSVCLSLSLSLSPLFLSALSLELFLFITNAETEFKVDVNSENFVKI